MCNISAPTDERSITDGEGGRGQGKQLTGAELKGTAIGANREKESDSDAELHLEGEEAQPDALYDDGIDIEEVYDTPAGTRGSSGTIP